MTKDQIIKEGRDAYTWYMYYECADRHYDAKASCEWFSKLCNLRTKAMNMGINPEEFEK